MPRLGSGYVFRGLHHAMRPLSSLPNMMVATLQGLVGTNGDFEVHDSGVAGWALHP